jgi:site-specific DNA-cytosine methylase
MRVLIACEYSGVVREAFRKRGHDAWSCDLLESDDSSPFHFKQDVLEVLVQGWDLMIAHPPCTHLAVSGAKHFHKKVKEQAEALDFVRVLLNAPISKIALENPVSVISSKIRKPDQIVQPWMFGDPFTKTTCLWLKGLPKLVPTKIVDKGARHVTKSGKSLPQWYNLPPSKDRWKIRSRTFQGFADAMAEQWG